MTWQRVRAQIGFETRAVLRNGEQLLLTFLIPLIALVTMLRTAVVPLPEPRAASAMAGVVALAVVATCFTSQAIAIAFDRRWGVLRLLGTTPLGPTGLLLGKLGAVTCVLGAQVVALSVAGLVLGWRPTVASTAILGGVVLVVVGGGTFLAYALVIAGTMRPEGVLALANVLFVVMALGGGLLVPLEAFPQPLAAVLRFLPPGALGEGLRELAAGGRFDVVALVVLSAWGVLGGWLATRFFRWDA